ncbi:hypothetical protein [Spiroplasma clarkii]|uniref:hypothetical protein n=1 Tax=Spiroplasma clarkii TaxID=2139 RepID=UPI0011BA7686|nr:hypothetical protein [Spiroplasma clarkii]
MSFSDNLNYHYLCAFPEIILMGSYCQKEFVLIAENVKTNVLTQFQALVRSSVDKVFYKIPKRFSNMTTYIPSTIPFFSNKYVEGETGSFPSIIIYEKNLNKCLIIIENFYQESARLWTDEKNAMNLLVGKNPKFMSILNQTYYAWFKDFKKLRKSLKIPKDAEIEIVIAVNRSLKIKPKITVEDCVVYIIDIALIDHFLTNFIYKR